MKPKVCAHTVAWLIKALMEQPRTPRELVEVAGLGRDGVYRFCKSMHEQGATHIVDWRFDGANYIPVYALGPGTDVVHRWNKNERKLFEIFGQDLTSRSGREVAKLVKLDPSTIRKDLNVLTEKGYLIRNPVKNSNEAYTWRRNPKMAFPDFGASTQPYTAKPYTPQRPKPNVPQQSWFSAIT
jgi:hypothetical protein